MEKDDDFNSAAGSMMLTTQGVHKAHAALTDALLVVLHDRLPGFTADLVQLFEGILPSAAQGLEPTALQAFYQQADSIRHQLDVLQTVPRRG